MTQTHAGVLTSADRLPLGRVVAVLAAMVAVQAFALWAMGQPLTCACGTVRLWSGAVLSAENSQQLSDWYTPSHVIHGIAFFYGLRVLTPRLSLATTLAIALGLEIAWELVENSPAVIEHYRAQALGIGYSGDSIVNSVSDTLAMTAGFLIARAIPGWAALALVAGLELFTAFMIRDGLLLNIVQFVYPLRLIADWQSGYS